MLVLSRKAGEKIRIGDEITIVVNRVTGSRVSVGIEAPPHVRIVRGELELFTDGGAGREASSQNGPCVAPVNPQATSVVQVPGNLGQAQPTITLPSTRH
ncbi:MAG: carbon storage regulator [Planctomycetia bacterium]|nr:carbon storage regulator [Planctomycetia bacterium]